jgi:hypothetical protein
MKRIGSLVLVFIMLYPIFIVSQLAAAAVAYVPMTLHQFWGTEAAPPAASFAIILMQMVLAAITGFWAGVPVARYLLRAFPLRPEAGRRWGCALMLLLSVVAGVVAVVYLFALGYSDTDRPADLRPRAIPTLIGLIIFVSQMALALRVYASSRDRLDKPFIVYLRRFRSFSDRVVFQAVLEAAPAGVPVATLVRTSGGPRDLNPWMIGFSGYRFRRPLASVPLPFVTADANWEQHARSMLERAACIVVDGSQDSPAMATEYGLIRNLGLAKKTVVLRDVASTSSPVHFPGAEIVDYRRSWWAAAPRVVGLYLLVVAYLGINSYTPLTAPLQPMILAIPFLLLAAFQADISRASAGEIRRHIFNIVHGENLLDQGMPPRWVCRALALLLLPGGLVGGVVYLAGTFHNDDGWTFNLFASASALIFLCSAWLGLQLWRGLAFQAASVRAIFAAQLFRLAGAGAEYEFCTGLCFGPIINDPEGHHFNLTVGVSSHIGAVAPGNGSEVVNLIALAALVCLLWPWRGRRSSGG